MPSWPPPGVRADIIRSHERQTTKDIHVQSESCARQRLRGDTPAQQHRYGPSGSGRAGTRSVGRSPDKPMLWISSSHEKQTAIKPRASRDGEFHVNESDDHSEEASLSGTAPVPSISRHAIEDFGSDQRLRQRSPIALHCNTSRLRPTREICGMQPPLRPPLRHP